MDVLVWSRYKKTKSGDMKIIIYYNTNVDIRSCFGDVQVTACFQMHTRFNLQTSSLSNTQNRNGKMQTQMLPTGHVKYVLPVGCLVKSWRFGGLYAHYGVHLCCGIVLHRTSDGEKPTHLTTFAKTFFENTIPFNITWVGKQIQNNRIKKLIEAYKEQKPYKLFSINCEELTKNGAFIGGSWQVNQFKYFWQYGFSKFEKMYHYRQDDHRMRYDKVISLDTNNINVDSQQMNEIMNNVQAKLDQIAQRSGDANNVIEFVQYCEMLNQKYQVTINHLSEQKREIYRINDNV